MSRSTLLLLLLVIYASKTSSFAQKLHPTLGLRTGISFSSKYGSALFHMPQYSRVGFSPGLFVHLPLSEDATFVPELSYVKQGFRVDDVQIYSDCLQLNLLTNIRLGITHTYITLGPYVSYLLNKSIHTPQEKSIELGGIVGLGFELGTHLTLDTRYHSSSQEWPFDYGLLRNTFVDVSLGYHF